MILSRSPLRIGLAGGGTDLPAFYKNYGPGVVVSLTIDKYVNILVNQPMENKVRVSYSKTENVVFAKDVEHDLVRACLRRMGITHRIEIVSVSDIPGEGTGLGSSSAFTVGLLNALAQYGLEYGCNGIEPIEDVAEEAFIIERDKCGNPCGKQDQYAAAYGGLNCFEFYASGEVVIKRIPISESAIWKLENNLMLFWTGITRQSSPILAEQAAGIENKEATKVLFSKMLRDNAEEMYTQLTLGNLDAIGDGLYSGWLAKKSVQSNVTTPEIDKWHDAAIRSGATGGKLCGAGGGGFLLFYVPRAKQEDVKRAIGLRQIPFKIDMRGTRLLYQDGYEEKKDE